MLTIWCIAVVFLSIVAVGIPVRWLLGGCKQLDAWAWIEAPFVGVATIVVLLQNLIYIDVPIGQSTLFLWLGILVLWAILIRSGQVRASIAKCPYWLFVTAVAVYLVQGLGLLLVGAQYYVGRAWSDQVNYVSIAQFLMDEPFSTPFSAIGHRPYLAAAIVKKWDRIGQSVLHGFFATSSLHSAKVLFEPTILLASALIVCAIYAVCVKIGLTKMRALAASIAAGLLPSVAMVHLESFQSQALMMPLLILFPVILNDLSRNPGWSRIAIAALIFAAATSIYTEFWIVLIGLMFLNLFIVVFHHPRYQHLIGCYIALVLAPFALLPSFVPSILTIVSRVNQPVLQSLYPWAFQIEGLSRLWLGDLAATEGLLQGFSRSWGILLTALAFYGLISLVAVRITPAIHDWSNATSRRPLALAMSVLAVAALPSLVLAQGDRNPYQFYKLLLSVSPFFIVGLAWLCQATGSLAGQSVAYRPTNWFYRAGTILVLGTVITLGATGTASAAVQSGGGRPRPRQNDFLLLNPGMRELQVTLEELRGKNLLVTEPGGYLNGWVTYFARYNQIWLGSSDINGVDLNLTPETAATLNLSHLPDDILILSNTANSRSMIPKDATIFWSGIAYTLWKPGSYDWAIVLNVSNKNGLERSNGKDFFWMGTDDTTIRVLSHKAGVLRMMVTFVPGPSVSGKADRTLIISCQSGYHEKMIVGAEDRTIAVPVQQGINEIMFHSLDQPNVAELPNGESRKLVLGVKGLWLTIDG